ncbi:TonB-dependent receptor [Gaoshiqia sp. Z1-71]|uniref:TonB-dependent receptor n=1 Tax=Gaoshiqia hydrogeniformans TaxID=3290090 RepID=UPI003BF7F168
MMRLCVLLILLASVSVTASVYAQNSKLTLKMKNSKIADVFNSIEEQSDYYFFYNRDLFDDSQLVSVDIENKSVTEILDELFKGKNISYKIVDRNILIEVNAGKLNQMNQQKADIRGKVTDSSGAPLPGVSVMVKGTTTGTITDFDGNYLLSNLPVDAILVFSFVGMKGQAIRVAGESNINIVLVEETVDIEQVVVIGYGTRQRKSVMGAIDQVGSEVFKNRPVSNAMQALQGASPNLIIQQRNMNPNDNTMNINVRGVSSMAGSDPLIVIDGLISDTGTLNNLNPNDIETVSVLKDASAAIYGSRSANGVILVITKKGTKSDRPIIRFNEMIGNQTPKILFHPVNGWENAMLRNQALINGGAQPMYTPEEIRDLYDHRSEESWWLDENLRTALQQSYNLSVSGGTNNTTYMISGGYYKQENNFLGDYWLKRFNFRSNLSAEWGRVKLTNMMAYTRRAERTVAGGTGSIIIDSSRIPPYYFYKQKEDGLYFINNVNTELNPRAQMEQGGYEKKDEDNFMGSVALDIKIIDGLKVRGVAGLDLTQHHRFRRWQQVPLYNWPDKTFARYLNATRRTDDYNNKRYTLSTQLMIDFDRTFNSVHQITALLGASNESFTREDSQVMWRYTDEDLGLPTTELSEQVPGDNWNTPYGTDMSSITSVFGRFGYNYQEKYYGEFTFRYDASSKFPKDNRWGFFPSFSAGWRISEEDFLDFYKQNIGNLKIRGTYGVLGNQNVNNYAFYTVYQMRGNRYAFNNSTVPGIDYTLGNEKLTWEISATFNIGIDATFFKNRLNLSLDYFDRRTSDILLPPIVPSAFGTNAAYENIGEMKNCGWEANFGYHLATGNVSHRFNFNVADQKNKVTKYGDPTIRSSDQMYSIVQEGYALGSYFGYKTAGFFQSYEEIANSVVPLGFDVHPGDVKYIDSNGDGMITDADRVVYGNAFPRYTFGFTYDVAWKGFDFSMIVQGVGKRDQYIRGELLEPFHEGYSQSIYKHQLDFWTPENPNARYPRLTGPSSSSNNNNWQRKGSDIYMLNAAYLRLKNIQLGYTLPQNFTSRYGITRTRVSLNAQNVFTLCENSFVDPESTEYGNDMGGRDGSGVNASSGRNFPPLKYYGIGLELDF